MKRKWIWYPTCILLIIGSLVFVIGFYNALSIGVRATGTEKKETTPLSIEAPMIEDTQAKTIFALGDSLARGTGDLDAGGFVGRSIDKLEMKLQKELSLFNVSVEGLKVEELLLQVSSERLIEGIQKADLIFLTIGGNNLRTVQNIPSDEKQTFYEQVLNDYLKDLDLVIERLRAQNDQAVIAFIGLYHLDYSEAGASDAAFVLNWNYETQLLLERYDNTLFIPTYDLFKMNHKEWLSFDQLHPNALGHEGISNRILEVLNN